MTEIFIKGILIIGIASAVLCILLALFEVVMILIGREYKEHDD